VLIIRIEFSSCISLNKLLSYFDLEDFLALLYVPGMRVINI